MDATTCAAVADGDCTADGKHKRRRARPTTIDWDDDSRNWSRPGAQTIADTVLAEVHPGAIIIIMHDGPADRQQTLDALPLILAGLKARGLTLVTVPQLLMDSHFAGVRLPSGPGAPLPALVRVAIEQRRVKSATVTWQRPTAQPGSVPARRQNRMAWSRSA
jgi:hypothetical protein